MKTRIISATVGVLLFLAVLMFSTTMVFDSCYPVILTVTLAVLAAIATYEILNNTKIVKNKIITVPAMIFAAGGVFMFSYGLDKQVMLVYFVYIAILLTVSLFIHEKTSPVELAAAQAYPLFLAISFSCLDRLQRNFGLFAFLLVFLFAWCSDTFAYFTGVFFGKHKLCPALSPKKTVEGAVGGIVGCMLSIAVACLIEGFTFTDSAFWILTLTAPVFSVLGMVGDISASYIKRHSGIKDYGNIMPGHGGVLDRFDSVLLITPVFYSLLYILFIINI